MALPFHPQPKPEPRKKLKARTREAYADAVAKVRAYVVGRERGMCRCCRSRRGESMHEVKPRSLGGKVSKRNSIFVCGDGVRGCHGYLQRHEIQVCWSHGIGADGDMTFVAVSDAAAQWMKVKRGHSIYSPLMSTTEMTA